MSGGHLLGLVSGLASNMGFLKILFILNFAQASLSRMESSRQSVFKAEFESGRKCFAAASKWK